MKRALAMTMLVLSACSNGASSGGERDGAIPFRVLSEQANARACHEAPDFMIAADETRWIDVFDIQTECRADQAEIELPAVDFSREVAVVAWWIRVGCPGHRVRTDRVERRGDEIWVHARTAPPAGPCAQVVAQLESFLAVERGARMEGIRRWRFELDGRPAGELRL